MDVVDIVMTATWLSQSGQLEQYMLFKSLPFDVTYWIKSEGCHENCFHINHCVYCLYKELTMRANIKTSKSSMYTLPCLELEPNKPMEEICETNFQETQAIFQALKTLPQTEITATPNHKSHQISP
ncbi:hypothetical protein CEXT_707991 [Caerostris extrusa]|uniref:Uncharacterized protein n=1 Tax=Caerostris extrusa TaxID=172846 RepID=A0AAV4PT54_CAEEX|nr:hypothetical protein CEXT_707991 [Caerostris extrusa]